MEKVWYMAAWGWRTGYMITNFSSGEKLWWFPGLCVCNILPKGVRGHFGGSFPFSPYEGEPQPWGCLPTSPLHSLQQTFKKLKALLPAKGSEDQKARLLKSACSHFTLIQPKPTTVVAKLSPCTGYIDSFQQKENLDYSASLLLQIKDHYWK